MTNAGRKILKGARQAVKVAKGEPPPGTRVQCFSEMRCDADRLRVLAWMMRLFETIGDAKMQITIEFPKRSA